MRSFADIVLSSKIQTSAGLKADNNLQRMQKILLILLCIFTLSACHTDRQKAFMHKEEQTIEIYRYDRLQYEASLSNSVAAIQKMNMESPQATKILIEDVLGLGAVDSPKINERVRDYYKDTVLVQVMTDVRNKFSDLTDLEEQFTKGFKRLKKELPDLVVPRIYTQISALNQSVVVGDSLLGISLDKYLGEDYPIYKRYYYAFQRKSMNPERILPDCFKFYLISQYPFGWEWEHRTLFDVLMYQGKIAWVVEKALKADGLGRVALGYSREEVKWCDKKAKEVWEIMQTRNYMTSMDPMLIRAFASTDPNRILKERNIPSGIGTWMGMQIIERYMKQHKDVTMDELLQCTDYHRILRDTRF